MRAQENYIFNPEYQNVTSNIEAIPEYAQSPFHASNAISEIENDLTLQNSC